VTTIDLAHLLSSGGAIARRLQNYEPRPQQIQMADAVAHALATRSQLLVEAGTGVGKSFAYLLPAIQRIVESEQRVVVATHTISLQEQLIEKDLPLLHAVIPHEFSSVLVKGRGNYLSIRRLKLASERQDRLFGDDALRHSLHTIEDWAYSTTDGSLATLPQLQRPDVWDYARSDSHNCMGKKCETYNKCFYQAARRRMENGDLLICNHAIFFADLAMRAQGAAFLPTYDHVILDEAHSIEDVAAEHFGISLAESRVQFLLRLLYRPNNGSGFLASLGVNPDGSQIHDETIRQTLKCYEAADAFFDVLHDFLEGHRSLNGRVPEPDLIENPLSSAMKALSERLRLLKRHVAKEADEFELNSYAQRALDIANEADMLIGQKIEGCVYWLEQAKGRRFGSSRPRIIARCAPIEVGPILRESLFAREMGVVMTSATLAAQQGNFTHIQGRLGCEGARTMQLGSPFDYASQMMFIVDRAMPDPRDHTFNDAIEAAILRHVTETGGGSFILFTSFGMLNEMADRLCERFSGLGYPVLVHGRDGPRSLLLSRFREAGNAVLFGTSSFWEGVDVRGDALRNVIITKLPFDVPDQPLVKARWERIEERGGNAFFEDSVPRAVIRFKQGFGRLIRSTTDEGRVVVLDPRIATKPYGRAFLDALPGGVRVGANA